MTQDPHRPFAPLGRPFEPSRLKLPAKNLRRTSEQGYFPSEEENLTATAARLSQVHTQELNDSQSLPRARGERWSLGLMTLPLSVLFGTLTVVLALENGLPLGLWGTIFLCVAEELSLATTLVCVLGTIWAVAMPRWVESLFRSAWKKMFLAIVFATTPILVFMIAHWLGIGPKVGPAP